LHFFRRRVFHVEHPGCEWFSFASKKVGMIFASKIKCPDPLTGPRQFASKCER
jgi:hypothetical protein